MSVLIVLGGSHDHEAHPGGRGGADGLQVLYVSGRDAATALRSARDLAKPRGVIRSFDFGRGGEPHHAHAGHFLLLAV